MAKFSKRSQDVVMTISRDMGFTSLHPSLDGSVTFEIEEVGSLCLTPVREGSRILISLKRVPTLPKAHDLERFLSLSRWDDFLSVPINAGMSNDGGLLLVAAFDDLSITHQDVEQCVSHLLALHNEWASEMS